MRQQVVWRANSTPIVSRYRVYRYGSVYVRVCACLHARQCAYVRVCVRAVFKYYAPAHTTHKHNQQSDVDSESTIMLNIEEVVRHV